MLSAALVWAVVASGQAASTEMPRPPACGVAPASGTAAAERCLGDDQLRTAEALPKQSAQRNRQLEAAAEHYRRAASLATSGDAAAQALEALTKVYDAQHLDQPRQVETALRELIAQLPNDLRPVFRLAKQLEDEGLIDAAEDTLLSARRQQPDGVDPYRMLAQFYARRATALSRLAQQQTPAPATGNPGERDENGVYRVGGPIPSPSRLDVARYPPKRLPLASRVTCRLKLWSTKQGWSRRQRWCGRFRCSTKPRCRPSAIGVSSRRLSTAGPCP